MKYVWILCFLLCQSAWSATQEEWDNRLFDLLIFGGTVQEIQEVIARGANPDAPFGKFKLTSLHYAIEYERPDLVEMLLTSANANPDIPDEFGYTPLCYAAQRGDRFSVLALLEANATVDARNKNGNTALHCTEGYPAIMADLLKAGADTNAQNNAGRTPAYNLAQCVPPNPFVVTAFMALGAEFDEAMQDRINQARNKQIASRYMSQQVYHIMKKTKIGEAGDLRMAIQRAKNIERAMQEAEKRGGSKLLVYETMQGESPMETLYAADEYFCKKYNIYKKHMIQKTYKILVLPKETREIF